MALLASLLVALTITPVLSLMLLDRAPRERQPSSLAAWLARRHEAVLTHIGHGRTPILLAGTLITLAGVAAWPLFRQSLLPEFKERDFLVHWVAPPGTSLTEMTRITTRVGSELLSIPGVNKVASSLGRAVNSETIPGPYEGELWVSIDPAADYHQMVARLQEVADGYPGVVHDLQTYMQDNVRHKLAETPDQITVRVYGSEEPVLREKAGEMATLVKEVPGVASALVGQRLETPSIEIETDLAKVELHGLKPGTSAGLSPLSWAAFKWAACSRTKKSSMWWCGERPKSGTAWQTCSSCRSTPRMAAVWRSAMSRPCASSRLNS